MKGQISRLTFDRAKRYSGVFLEMGRMVTDADDVERGQITGARIEALGADAAASGVPVAGGAVDLSGNAPALREGVIYADGLRGELRASGDVDSNDPMTLYGVQADFPQAPPLAGPALVYADLFERPVFSIEDPELVDPAFHGAATSFRTRIMTQIRLAPPGTVPGTGAFLSKGTARITEAKLREEPEGPDPCDPCASELDLPVRTGDHLFRLEVVHVEGPADAPTLIRLLWSSENAAERLATAGPIPADYKSGIHLYEFYSEVTEAHQGAFADPTMCRRSEIVTDFPASIPPRTDGIGAGEPEVPPWPFVRRWDGGVEIDVVAGTATLIDPAATDVAPTFDGTVLTLTLPLLEITLEVGGQAVLPGDFWLVDVREFAAEAERVALVSPEPVGIVHHYLALFALDGAGAPQPLADAERRRLSFPALTDLPASHVGFTDNCRKLFDGALNVQQALDNLCAIAARDIAFKNNCPRLYGSGGGSATTVQKALDKLCETVREGNGGCRVVVGPRGSGQPTLNDVLAEHGRSGEPLCVCLLPGDHLLEAPVDNPKLAIDIEGCGAGTSRIRVAGNWKVDAASLRLAATSVLLAEPDTGLKISVRDHFELDNALLANMTKETPLLTVSAGERIRIAHTRLEAMGSSAMDALFRFFEEGTHGDLPDQDLFKLLDHDGFDAAVDDLADKVARMSDADRRTYTRELRSFLDGAERLTVLERSGIEQLILHCGQKAPASTYRADFLRLRHAAAFSRPAPALVIETAVAQTLIESSEIRGVLSLYGPPADNPLSQEEARRLSNLGREITVFSTHRSLHVRDNRLARIAVDQKTVEQVRLLPQGAQFSDIFRQTFLSNNAIESDGSALVASAHHLSDLRFENQAGQREFLGYVVGTHAAYTGLSCEISSINGVPELYNLTTSGSESAVLVAVGVVP